MAIEVDEALLPWNDEDADVLSSTERIAQAVDAFRPEARSQERARNVGMSQVFVLVIALALVLATVVTLNQLVSDAMRGIEQGM